MDSGPRRQFGTEANRRHLRDLPLFRVEAQMPGMFDELLAQIDRVEQKRAGRQD